MVKGKDKAEPARDAGIGELLFSSPFQKFIVSIIVYLSLEHFLESMPGNHIARLVITVLHSVISVYFLLLIVHMVRRSLRHLMRPTSIFSLIGAYSLFILSIILILTTLLNGIEYAGIGYIKYGTCSDNFSDAMIGQDAQSSHSFFYFTAITFLAVGYGDICPMGAAKIFAVITAFIGHLVSVMLVALIINNFIRLRQNSLPEDTRK